ncbi:MAG TPA: hypothetical protein VMR34_00420 [Candidatus Saccharimonadales bacterium]|nr:hypothetical protein [Candidatus Saccharimonadales bacterium]
MDDQNQPPSNDQVENLNSTPDSSGSTPPSSNEPIGSSPDDHVASPFSVPPNEISTETPKDPKLSSPISDNKIQVHKQGFMPLVLTIIAVIIFIGTVYGVYGWQHQSVSKLNSQLSAANSNVSSLKTSLANAKTTASAPNTVKIAPLGISLVVPSNLANLTYVANAQGSVVNVSSQTLTDLDPACTATSSGTNALGDLSKVTGNYSSSTSVTLVKQFSGYYIGYSAAKTPCSTVSQVNSLVTTLTTSLKTSFSSASSTD